MVDNVEREIREASYDIYSEDEPPFELPGFCLIMSVTVNNDVPHGVDPKERARLEYGNFSEKEKIEMLERKLAMLQELEKNQKLKEEAGVHDAALSHLVESLKASLLATQESEIQRSLKENTS